jgi:hypothetical protein
MWLSPTQGDKLNCPAPFATVALAGHTMSGGIYCQCDDPNSHLLGLIAPDTDSAHQDDSTTQGDLGIELGIAFVALMVWLKLRA